MGCQELTSLPRASYEIGLKLISTNLAGRQRELSNKIHWVSVALRVRLIAVTSRSRAQALGHAGFSSCSTWARKLRLTDPGAQAQ